MKRLNLLLSLFAALLCLPLAFFAHGAYRSMEREEQAELRFFAGALFDDMERELAARVEQEEKRPIDDYGASQDEREQTFKSPAYILGYLQNNPDGSAWTTSGLVNADGSPARATAGTELERLTQLGQANALFNQLRWRGPEPSVPAKPAPRESEDAAKKEKAAPEPSKPAAKSAAKADQPADRDAGALFADKYLDLSRSKKQKERLGQETARTERLTPDQAQNFAQFETEAKAPAGEAENARRAPKAAEEQKQTAAARPSPQAAAPAPALQGVTTRSGPSGLSETALAKDAKGGAKAQDAPAARTGAGLAADLDRGPRVEIAPLQSLSIDDARILVFRRILIDNRSYRQGFVLSAPALLDHLRRASFNEQPLARFTTLRLSVVVDGRESAHLESGASPSKTPAFRLERVFPQPFQLMKASLSSAAIPASSARSALNAMVLVTAAVLLLGLLAIHRAARAVNELAVRRAAFASSVTHELKTPLTNIRLYLEMLDEGVAGTPEQEREYLRILRAESARLSRLIESVLDLSKLERKERSLEVAQGTFEEVAREVESLMAERIAREGFVLRLDHDAPEPFLYDRSALVQILLNCIENSLKFGARQPRKELDVRLAARDGFMEIRFSDTGPGIPPRDLSRVFDDFYRCQDAAANVSGTGIGLALVRKYAKAMGGKVRAANNQGPGCSITLFLPLARTQQSA